MKNKLASFSRHQTIICILTLRLKQLMGAFLFHYLFFSFILQPPGYYWVITLLGTLSKHDDDGSENVGKKWICVLSNLIASIWTRWICQMQATFPGVEFLRTFSASKRATNVSGDHCTTTTWNLLIWRFMEDVDIRRRILHVLKSVMHVQSCCFDD